MVTSDVFLNYIYGEKKRLSFTIDLAKVPLSKEARILKVFFFFFFFACEVGEGGMGMCKKLL